MILFSDPENCKKVTVSEAQNQNPEFRIRHMV